jgi:hypothetical protein
MSKLFQVQQKYRLKLAKKLKHQRDKDQTQWSKILSERCDEVRKTTKAEKQIEIDQLKKENKELKDALDECRKDSAEVEQLKNELHAKSNHLDYEIKQVTEIHNRLSIQIGTSERVVREARKLLKKKRKKR